MLQIPIQPVPSQQVLCVLGGQNCQISIYQKGDSLLVDLNVDGSNICIASLAHNGVPLDSRNSYDGFQGNLYFIDTQGLDDPEFAGLGSRWVLIYLTPAEVLLTAPILTPIIPSFSLMTLAATLTVTAVAGNFSVTHSLRVVPVLIEILPTSGGLIWGQANFADSVNVNLVGSDNGVTATILVYTAAVPSLEPQSPAETLNITSPAPGPFGVPHGLGAEPSLIELLPTSFGLIWAQSPAYDATNIYLEASESDQTVTVSVFGPLAADSLNLEVPATTLGVTSIAPGDFSVPHGLTSAPSRISILMISAGMIVAQTPAFDDSNVYLSASDTGIIAKIFVYA